ncbi:hypothetical protein CVU83_03370 [Candidatus Falkowbacteria bacterium HGW-Falkowbacteria-2]|uniref:Protein kinase domain-containing protein n=1 Tax=Candidatus Falkowbacteria bacterium HGW-Falkowbacteria-2 TaxID=2013769 RepID=A0A2N2DXH1_9BACT|nr:MAG: hypothetical protein CVU83_03370 [Candidatus Falkowbacteria bacterium HGW-Falkowbacteria-2]
MSEKLEFKPSVAEREAQGKEMLKRLTLRLTEAGLSEDALNQYRDLIERVNFSNIDFDSPEGKIHVDMFAALLSRQPNGEVYFQNILAAINKDWHEIKELSVVSVKEVVAESIDLDIGTNRRVDRVKCAFGDNDAYEFTLSADLEDHVDPRESNSFVEKEVYDSPTAKNNPWLQKYFGYMETKLSGRSYRLIAKEYLPGKNIAQYCNELEPEPEISSEFINVACEAAYTMGGIYKHMQGRILSDLKLENIIYNYQNTDSAEPACRICDHSGIYDNEPERHGVAQILAQLSSLIEMYYAKARHINGVNDEDCREVAVEITSAYIESFLSEAGEENEQSFFEQIANLKTENINTRPFDLSDDLLDYILINKSAFEAAA